MPGFDLLLAALLRTAGFLRRDVVGCFFTFHRAALSGDWAALPNRDFYIDIQFLDALLTYLIANGWSIVTVEEALLRSAAGVASRFVNFSIDDCYRDTYELVVPLFRKHGVPVTLFVTTGIPDGTLTLWHAGLEQTLRERESVVLDDEVVEMPSPERKRELYRSTSAAWDGPFATQHYAVFCAANGLDADAMRTKHAITWDMLASVVGDPCVEIGSHTVDHPRISALSEGEAFAELEQSRMRLQARLGIPVRHFAFPYGRSGDAGERDFDLARQAGYKSASTTRKGLVRADADPFSLARNTLNGRHKKIFQAEIHLSGMSGLAARFLNRV